MQMRSLPVKYQILVAPMVMIIPILLVILLTLSYLEDIGKQNDTVRDWAQATDQLQIGISAINHIQETLALLAGNKHDNDELMFDYMENATLLTSSLKQPVLAGKIDQQTLSELQQQAQLVKQQEQLNPAVITPLLETLLPRLEFQYRNLQAKKRGMYIASNEDISRITSRLASVSISVLAICVLLGVAIALWINKSTGRRLKHLTLRASNLCHRPFDQNLPRKPRNELDELASCLSFISQRQLHLLATEKLLEGAEEERRRIAADLHDQFLSDVSALSHDMDTLAKSSDMSNTDKQHLASMQNELRNLTVSLRGIIDDLHPSSLSILGLEAALRSFLKRKLSASDVPDYYLSIAPGIDSCLDMHTSLNLYRIILELVNNILRHAHCTRFEITLQTSNDEMILTVEDNGVGFDEQQAMIKGGHGLLNIDQRTLAIHGEGHWSTSRFSQGSCFTLRLPVMPQQQNKGVLKASAHA